MQIIKLIRWNHLTIYSVIGSSALEIFFFLMKVSLVYTFARFPFQVSLKTSVMAGGPVVIQVFDDEFEREVLRIEL